MPKKKIDLGGRSRQMKRRARKRGIMATKGGQAHKRCTTRNGRNAGVVVGKRMQSWFVVDVKRLVSLGGSGLFCVV